MNSSKPHPEDSCDDCGLKNVVWFAPSKIWNFVVRDKEDPMLCPTCFIKRAENHGYDSIWEISPQFK